MCVWLGICAALSWHVGEETRQHGQDQDWAHLAAKGDHGYNMYERMNERKKQRAQKCRDVVLGKGKR